LRTDGWCSAAATASELRKNITVHVKKIAFDVSNLLLVSHKMLAIRKSKLRANSKAMTVHDWTIYSHKRVKRIFSKTFGGNPMKEIYS